MPNVSVIGGGTGTMAVLTGLKKYPDLNLSVIVSMADDGGSNAVIRDEFGLLPLSDLRKSLIALAQTDNTVLRELFTYRFSKGNGLAGHTLGNLLMTALSEIRGSELEAIEAISRLFQVRGTVLPVTLERADLVAEYSDGTSITGEHLIDEPGVFTHDKKITNLFLAPPVSAFARAKQALLEADAIIAGPGDLYTTTLANVIVPGITEALAETSGKLILVINLMTKQGQTHWMKASDLVAEFARHAKRQPDVVVMHTGVFNPQILEKYSERSEYPIEDDIDDEAVAYRVLREEVANQDETERQAGDTLIRSLIRHDAEKLGKILYQIIGNPF